ncbi:hypothetical protein CYLTODRAFT_483107, partial [Cylindrobasidium torrendii FP15055 ss-10]
MNISAYFVDFQTLTDKTRWERMKSLLLPPPSLTKPAHAAKRWKVRPWVEYIEWSCAMVSEGKENQAMEVHQMMTSYVDSCFWMFEFSAEKVVDNRAGGPTKWRRYSPAEEPGTRCIRILLNPRFAKRVQPSSAPPVLDENAPGFADDADDDAIRAHREAQDPLIQALYNIEDGIDDDDDDDDVLNGRQTRINVENQLVRQRMARSARMRPFANSYDAEERQLPQARPIEQNSQGLGRGVVRQESVLSAYQPQANTAWPFTSGALTIAGVHDRITTAEGDATARNKRLQSKATYLLQEDMTLQYENMITAIGGWLEDIPTTENHVVQRLLQFSVTQRNKVKAAKQKSWEEKYGSELDEIIAAIKASKQPSAHGKGKDTGKAPGESSGPRREKPAGGSRPNPSSASHSRATSRHRGVSSDYFPPQHVMPSAEEGASMASLLRSIREREMLNTLLRGADAGLVPRAFVQQIFEKARRD